MAKVQVEKICKTCGNTFVCTRTNQIRTRNFCSRACLCKDESYRKALSEGGRRASRNLDITSERSQEAQKRRWKKYYSENPFIVKGVRLNKTIEFVKDYKDRVKVCEICGESVDQKGRVKYLCVDHCHKTNKFRGLLCNACNSRLGWYEEHLADIENYLNREV